MQKNLGVEGLIGPDDLTMLEGILLEWCRNHGVDRSSSHAASQAKQIIELFEHGWRSPGAIRVMMEPFSPASE